MAEKIEKKFVELSFGKIAYLEVGEQHNPPVLFVHGVPTSSYLWRHVFKSLQNDFHCYAPDLMGLGHSIIDPDQDKFKMEAQAEMLLEFMSVMGHQKFSLVCHDQGGAAAQIIAARQKERLECFIITNSVCYDNWPVPVIAFYQKMLKIPFVFEMLAKSGTILRVETNQYFSAFKKGVYNKDKMTDDSIKEYLAPLQNAQARLNFKKFILAGSCRCTQQILPDLKTFDKPTLIIWGADDNYISPSWGKQLYEDIQGAQSFELIPFCGHFWQEEKPAEFTAYLSRFLTKHIKNKL